MVWVATLKSISFFISERRPDMTEILLTGTKAFTQSIKKLTPAFLNSPYGEHSNKNYYMTNLDQRLDKLGIKLIRLRLASDRNQIYNPTAIMGPAKSCMCQSVK